MHYELGYVIGRLGDYRSADEHLREALALFADLGDRATVAQVAARPRYAVRASRAGTTRRLTTPWRRCGCAVRWKTSAAVAYSENAVGWILAHLGQPDAALWYCRRALEMHTESGSRTGVADTLDSIAYAYGQLGGLRAVHRALRAGASDVPAARRPRKARPTSRLHLGDIQFASGQENAARRSWEQALALLTQVPGADTGEVSGRLRRTAPGADSRNMAAAVL